jgi:hypothetical protein
MNIVMTTEKEKNKDREKNKIIDRLKGREKTMTQ